MFDKLISDITLASNIQINRVDKKELTYELAIRGIGTGAVQEMRHRLTVASQMEKAGESLQYPTHPFTCQVDYDVVKKKIGELTPLIEAIDNTTPIAQCQKLNTKVTYLIRRINNMKAETEADTKLRSAVLGEVLSLIKIL